MTANSNSTVSLNKRLNALLSQVSNATGKVGNSLAGSFQDTKNKLNNKFDNIGRNSNGESTLGNIGKKLGFNTQTSQSFAEANSTLAKFSFILLLIFLFGLILRLGTMLLSNLFLPSKNPVIVSGIRPTNKSNEYQVNPNSSNPKPILRSINQDQGMEFSWSTWIYIEDTDYDNDNPRKIFSKGISTTQNQELGIENSFVMNSPGLYLYDGTNNKSNSLTVVMSTYDENDSTTLIQKSGSEIYNAPYESITINNIPMQKWVHVAIRVQNKTMDVYINGVLTQRKNLTKIPKQNYGNVYVGDSKNGMNGYISSLRYFNYALSSFEINNIIRSGPNMKMEGKEWKHAQPPYLAMRWYFDANSAGNR